MKIYEVIEDRRRLHFITDFYDGGELLDYILESNSLSERKSSEYMY